MYSPGVDAVVVAHRTPADLDEFLASYHAFPPSQGHLTIVVNDPEIVDEVVVHSWSEKICFRYLRLDNVGYNRACNIAGSAGEHDTIALLNADTVLADGALDQCRELLWSQDDWGILGPRQVDEKNRFTAAGIFGPLSAPTHRGWHEPDRGQYSEVRDDAALVSGSAFFIKRTVWDELCACPKYRAFWRANWDCDPPGALLETFGYWGETATCTHAAFHGWKRVYAGSVRIIHKHHRSSRFGGVHEQQAPKDQALFRAFCDEVHGMEHD